MTKSAGFRSPTAPGELPLTPRQKQVLDLLVQHKTNAEIGASLGISLDGAKWHVTEVIGRLGVDNREEAADFWRHYNGLPARLSRVWRAAVGLPCLKWFGFATVGGATVGAAVAGALIIYNQANQTQPGVSEGPDAATAVPGISTPIGSGGAGAGAPTSITATIGAPQGLAPNTTMLVVEGCTECDGPEERMVRYSSNSAGQVTRTDVTAALPLKPGEQATGGFGASVDGSVLAAVVCDRSSCGGLGPADPSVTSRLLLSRDGGSTWTETASLNGYVELLSVSRTGTLATLVAFKAGTQASSYALIQARIEELVPPASAGDDARPFHLSNGEIVWLSAGRQAVLEQDGTPLISLGFSADAQISDVQLVTGGKYVVAWRSPVGDRGMVSIFASNGQLEREITLGDGVRNAKVVSSGSVIATVAQSAIGAPGGVSRVPVVIDLATGVITPISGAVLQQPGRNRPEAIFPIS